MKKYAIVGAICLCMLVVGTTFAQSPGHSKAFGKTLGEWMKLYTTWNMGGDQDNPEGKMVFLPNANDVPEGQGECSWNEDLEVWSYVGEMDAALEPGQKFALPLITLIGWQYEDGSEDDPDDEIWLGILHDMVVEVSLDGTVIIDSDDEDYEDFWFDVQYFDDPIPGDGYDLIWVQGYGFVHPPLSKGEHTLVWYFYSEDLGVENEVTLNITVEK